MPPCVFRVEKQDYSRGAWRVLDAVSGAQIYRAEQFAHPFLGPIVVDGPVCFERKRDALAWVARQIDLKARKNDL